MAVGGVGIDVAETERLGRAWRRHGDRFLDRVLHPTERARFRSAPDPVSALAEAFALKEAALKALGTGWANGLAFGQVESRWRGRATVEVRLHGAAGERARELGVGRIHATVTSCGREVWAVVVLESTDASRFPGAR
jgi:holo-[acyl-carrier protein] synthase